MKARERHNAAVFLRIELGAEVVYGVEEQPGFFTWLRENTGGDYYASVTEIRLVSSEIDDSILHPGTRVIDKLTKLPQLKRVDFGGTQITADGVERMRKALPHVSVSR